MDVTDASAMRNQILQWFDQEPIDLVIANAGISGGGLIRNADHQSRFEDVININVNGTLNTILPIISRMQQRGKVPDRINEFARGFFAACPRLRPIAPAASPLRPLPISAPSAGA